MADFPEAQAVWYTNFKNAEGWEQCITLRGESGTDLLTKADKAMAALKEKNCTPIPLRGGFQKKEAKPVEYVEGRTCPNDGAKLIYAVKKADGTKYIKCENSKYDFQKRQAYGCTFVEWPKPTQAASTEYGEY